MTFIKTIVIAADDSEFKLFRVQNTKHAPKVKQQQTLDPAGIYFFYKDLPPEGGVYENDWKFAYEGQLKSQNTLDLGQVKEEGSKWVLERIDDTNAALLALLEHAVEHENWQIDSYFEDVSKDPSITPSKFMEQYYNSWYHLLKHHFRSSKKFADFFLGKGHDVLEDHNGVVWETENDQCIVLRQEAVAVRPIDGETLRKIVGG